MACGLTPQANYSISQTQFYNIIYRCVGVSLNLKKKIICFINFLSIVLNIFICLSIGNMLISTVHNIKVIAIS